MNTKYTMSIWSMMDMKITIMRNHSDILRTTTVTITATDKKRRLATRAMITIMTMRMMNMTHMLLDFTNMNIRMQHMDTTMAMRMMMMKHINRLLQKYPPFTMSIRFTMITRTMKTTMTTTVMVFYNTLRKLMVIIATKMRS